MKVGDRVSWGGIPAVVYRIQPKVGLVVFPSRGSKTNDPQFVSPSRVGFQKIGKDLSGKGPFTGSMYGWIEERLGRVSD